MREVSVMKKRYEAPCVSESLILLEGTLMAGSPPPSSDVDNGLISEDMDEDNPIDGNMEIDF
jgi:hypothetical protein